MPIGGRLGPPAGEQVQLFANFVLALQESDRSWYDTGATHHIVYDRAPLRALCLDRHRARGWVLHKLSPTLLGTTNVRQVCPNEELYLNTATK
jgi:hypothetical protein